MISKTSIMAIMFLSIISTGLAFGEPATIGSIEIKGDSYEATSDSFAVNSWIYLVNNNDFDIFISTSINDGIAPAGESFAINPQECGNITFNVGIEISGTIKVPCPDTDGDGIIDSLDSCPTQPSTEPDGCPIPEPIIIPEEIVEEIVEAIEESTNDNVESTNNSTNSTTSEPEPIIESSPTEPEPVVSGTVCKEINDKLLCTYMQDYQGTEKFVYFTGGNFTTGETITINVKDSNNVLKIAIQTNVIGSGDFSVPAIVNIPDLIIGDYYTTVIGSIGTDIEVTLQWDGSDFSFVENTQPLEETIVEETTPIGTPSNTASTDYDDLWFSGLSAEDKLGVISAVMKDLFS